MYRLRGLKNVAIECYQVILENFVDTPFAIKSQRELENMGVKIKLPSENGTGEETEEEE